ncbi:MAG: hypothetical protein LBJ67_05890 [Planctomycetaceae bacterium]|nr:hypothetical protein [Planctomycetaceae bacterium]
MKKRLHGLLENRKRAIDSRTDRAQTPVLKLKLPSYESDYVLNIAYHFWCGGTAGEQIEDRRFAFVKETVK